MTVVTLNGQRQELGEPVPEDFAALSPARFTRAAREVHA